MDITGLEQQQGLLPLRPNARQANPKQPVGAAGFWVANCVFATMQLPVYQ